ncbi:MAG: ParA family protein [bacterium]|nr:ParA family protein [bacterium]
MPPDAKGLWRSIPGRLGSRADTGSRSRADGSLIRTVRHRGVGQVRSLVLANQKGGVGKTTTAIHLAHGFALSGKKVALFDMDPQGNATVAVQQMSGGHEAKKGALTMLEPVAKNLWLLRSPGAESLVEPGADIEVDRLLELVQELAKVVDWLVIDCPPRIDAWGWAGLQLGDEVLVPVQAEFFAIHGLSQMLAAMEVAAKQLDGKARIRGVLPTMVDASEPVTLEVVEDLRKNLGDLVLDSLVLRDSNLVEAASHGKTAFAHCPWARGALCYGELVMEILDG